MGVHKIRRDLAVAGTLTFGAEADAGFERKSANVVGLLSGDTLGTPSISAPNFSGAAAGTLNLADGELRTGTVAAALTNTNMGTAKPGRLIIGHSAGTIQFGFVHNGSAFIFSALAGTGAVTSAVG